MTRMRTSAVLAGAIAIALGVTGIRLAAQATEEAGVRAALEHYLQGHATGDGAHFRMAFHPEAKLFWVVGDTLRQMTAEQYAANASGRPPADEAQRRRRILHVDVSGTVAVAKVELDYPTRHFIDYMSLAKVNGAWKIVNKSYVAGPPLPR